LALLKAERDPRLAKLPDQLLGLSLLGWAVAGMVDAWPDRAAVVPVRLSLAALQTMVGVLLFLRPTAIAEGSLRTLLLSLPSFLISGILFRLAQPLGEWPTVCKWVFATAVAWVMASFWSLRGSFAIFPARRALVRTGLYRLVRHPAYLGELVMAVACMAASGSAWAWLCLTAIIPLVALRIRQEEQLLLADAGYGVYVGEVRWRLVYGVW
jgi:protein-S-isoprenylcysteine O-methyltransferase Ste14